MYSFGPIPRQKRSGRIIGTHQKIDRVARRCLQPYLEDDIAFPAIRDILHFEGSRGPDAIKIKSPGRDEPRHFINPSTFTQDDQLLVAIRDHSENLSAALVDKNHIRAAFEAAWLAHAVTDGLTPAHHELFDEQIKQLKSHDHENGKFTGRAFMTGHGSRRKFVENNWLYWGAKGIMTTHTLFEAGVATTINPVALSAVTLDESELQTLQTDGFQILYADMIRDIDQLQMYEQFKKDGWTRTLAMETRQELLPTIIKAVLMAWYEAYERALKSLKL